MAAYISFQPSDFFSTKLYTGTGSSNAVTGVGFQPDWLLVKSREHTYYPTTVDAVRGATKYLYTNANSAEATSANYVASLDADGFTLGTSNEVNSSTYSDFVSWNWKESTTSKLDIVQYSGTGSAQTIAHNLGVKPDLIIIKRTDTTSNWIVYHQSLGATKFMYFNTTDDVETNSGVFNNTEPTSSVFTVNTWNDVNNSSGTYIAYCFAPVKGYSKFGSYTGNGNVDGPFIYTGFRPAFTICKIYSGNTNDWKCTDDKRPGYNINNKTINMNASSVEGTEDNCDYLANGFKIRRNGNDVNGSGYEYIYMAFAEFPFVSSNSKAGTAR
jgi:hypothetical protein